MNTTTSRLTAIFVTGMVTALALAPALAEAPAGASDRTPEAIRQEIEATQAKIAALEREAAAAEQRKVQEQELADMKAAAKERIQAGKDELAEAAKPVEGDNPSPAERARRAARHAQVSTCIQFDEAIVKLEGAAKLPEARALQLLRELEDTKWAMVTAPAADRAVKIEALQQTESLPKKAREKLAAIQRMHEEDIKDASAEFDLRQKRAKAEAEINRLFVEADASVASGE